MRWRLVLSGNAGTSIDRDATLGRSDTMCDVDPIYLASNRFAHQAALIR
jgi:hypothetical protein